jgi:hypothetical protein
VAALFPVSLGLSLFLMFLIGLSVFVPAFRKFMLTVIGVTGIGIGVMMIPKAPPPPPRGGKSAIRSDTAGNTLAGSGPWQTRINCKNHHCRAVDQGRDHILHLWASRISERRPSTGGVQRRQEGNPRWAGFCLGLSSHKGECRTPAQPTSTEVTGSRLRGQGRPYRRRHIANS